MFYPRILNMKTFTLGVALSAALCLLLASSPAAKAQGVSVPGIHSPVKKETANQEVPVEIRAAFGQAPLRMLYDSFRAEATQFRRLPPLDPREVQAEKQGKRVRIGTARALGLPLDGSSDGTLYSLDSGRVRVMGVVSEGALYTRLHFADMSLPAGARVFVYSLKNPGEFYGPYEGSGPSGDGSFWTPPMEGDGAVVEYFSPAGAVESGAPFRVSEVSHIFRAPNAKAGAVEEDAAGACNLEVTGDWAEVAKSVGELEFTSDGGEYVCTGTLLNNQSNDLTPYLLTANHCFSTQTEAQSLRVYWNYNSGDFPAFGTPFTDGANLLATGTASDFTFVRLTGSLPGGLFFSGWATDPVSTGTTVTGIHHPEGSHKRISFGGTNSNCPSGLPGPCTNFTGVTWNAGTTEGGSSGSGLWKGTGTGAQLVGTLTGGLAACNNLSGSDYYGRFSVTYSNISSFLAGSGVDLSITKSAAYDKVVPGSNIVYLITVTNNSGAASAGNVTITDNLPSTLSFVSCSASGGTCGGAGNNRTVTFPTLAANTSATAVITATLDSSVASGTVFSNTATVSSSASDPNANNNTASATATASSAIIKPRGNGKISFGSDHAGSGSSLPTGYYTVSPQGTNESLLFNLDPFSSGSAWSPDGTKIAYGKRNFGTYGDEIYVANADGTGSVKVAGNVYSSNGRITWSPGGTKLAFIGTGSSIYVVNADGTGLSKLPVSPSFVNDLSWSPDGSKFAYSNGGDVYVMNIDGSGQTNLTQQRTINNGEQAGSKFPRWSPDGTRLMFTGESNNYRYVYVINADGTGLARLVNSHQSLQAAWSPDGTKITYVALNKLYVANADGTGEKLISGTGVYNFKPDWQSTAPPPATVQLGASSYTVSEGQLFAAITVTRTGDTSSASTVKYTTSDTTDVNFHCDPATAGQPTGVASRKCDYHLGSGRLRFGAGESTKQIVLSVVDDSYVEGPETFTLTLSDATGGSVGAGATATITITDNDAAGAPNPIDGSHFFVRQLYVDLLNREPDLAGWDGWTSRIDLCGQPGQAPPPCDRVTVGGDGFLRSSEFFDRQFFVLRLYRTAFGRILQYNEVGDLAYVSGFLSASDLELNKQELVAEIMTRSEFTTKYNGLTNASFVDTLLQTAAVTVPQSVRDAWVTALGNATKTRAQVFREISERAEVSNKYLTEAQVVSAYYGFFTRNPDGAYLNYLQRLNSGEINLGDLANAFINAAEYRQRFGK